MAEVCFLQSEYRARTLSYKYADYVEQDRVRRLERLRKQKLEEMEAAGENDDLDDGLLSKELAETGDKWEEQKAEQETLAVYNYRLKSTKYLECVIAASTS